MNREESRAIFEGPPIHQVIQRNVKKCVEEAHEMSENEVLSRTTDDIVSGFQEKYAAIVPKLIEEEIYTDQKEVQRIWEEDDFGRRITRTSTTHYIEFHVPFSGDATIFSMSPKSHCVFHKDILLASGELIISMPVHGADATRLKDHLTIILFSISMALSQAKRDFASLHQQIDMAVRPQVDKRRPHTERLRCGES
jgi:hypothetical protein